MIDYTTRADPLPFKHRTYEDRSDIQLLTFVFAPGAEFSQKRTDYDERKFLPHHQLTPGQRRAYDVLWAAQKPRSARQVAEALWPDSPAWARRTRRYGANRNGALGGTMPMNAAKLLHGLQAKGLARTTEDGYRWELT